jgi:hypothetical protein
MRSGEWCPCTTEDGVDLAVWNATLGKRWNRLCQDLRRFFGEHVEYFRAVEVQERGALHLHVLIRFRRGRRLRIRQVRDLAIKHGFGHSVDISKELDERGCWYVAKYVSKAASERELVPWVALTTGEVALRAPYRCWTASRRWGQTMAALRDEQRAWWESQAGGADPAPAGEHPPLDTYTDHYTNGESERLETENEVPLQ